jgi:hypothetical protein
VKSCSVTEAKLYIKVVAPLTQVNLQDLVDPGVHRFLPDGNPDYIQAGFVLSNSEVGAAALSIDELIFRLVCTNGLIRGNLVRRTHLGSRLESGEGGIVFRNETLLAEDRALMMRVEDAVTSAVDSVRFQQIAAQFAEAATSTRVERPVEAMQVLAPTANLTEAETGNILTHLAAGGDLSQFGLVNAITRAAQDVEDYDRATELEELGGKVLNYVPREWEALATAS